MKTQSQDRVIKEFRENWNKTEFIEQWLKDSLASFEAEIREETLEEVEKELRIKLRSSFTVAGLPAKTTDKFNIVSKEIEEVFDQLSSLSDKKEECVCSAEDLGISECINHDEHCKGEVDNFSGYPEQEQKEIVEKATKESNKMQKISFEDGLEIVKKIQKKKEK